MDKAILNINTSAAFKIPSFFYRIIYLASTLAFVDDKAKSGPELDEKGSPPKRHTTQPPNQEKGPRCPEVLRKL
jgi:hypothetical protein